MTHAERCEAVSQCRWVDEIAPDAPWEIDQGWIDRYNLDYVAHDEMVYAGKNIVDLYGFVKQQGELRLGVVFTRLALTTAIII